MPQCHVHGWYSADDDGCWMCRDAEERAQADRDEIIARLNDARRGPGDYECPHCRYISLRRGATRCPLCHGVIDQQLWQRIAAQEAVAEQERRAAAEAAEQETRRRERLAAEEWEQTRPAREAAERREADWDLFKFGVKALVFALIGCLKGALVGLGASLVIIVVLNLLVWIASTGAGSEGNEFYQWLRKGGVDTIGGIVVLAGVLIGAVIELKKARDL